MPSFILPESGLSIFIACQALGDPCKSIGINLSSGDSLPRGRSFRLEIKGVVVTNRDVIAEDETNIVKGVAYLCDRPYLLMVLLMFDLTNELSRRRVVFHAMASHRAVLTSGDRLHFCCY